MSLLSRDWHVILKPGDKYTGGNEFFKIKDRLVDTYQLAGLIQTP